MSPGSLNTSTASSGVPLAIQGFLLFPTESNIPLKLLLIISVVFDLSPLPECPLVMGQERVFLFTARSSGSSGQIVKSLVC